MNNSIDHGGIFDIRECPTGFYGEWVPVYNKQDEKDAYEYLCLWKKFLLMKLDYMQQKGEDTFIDRTAPSAPEILTTKPTLGLKIELERKP